MTAASEAAIQARIANGRTDLVFEFVQSGGAATAKDADGVSLLQWCSYYGDVAAMKFLVQNGETLQSLGEEYGLNTAAFHGHWRLCEFLLEAGADANWADPGTGETPLHSVLSQQPPGQQQVVKVLLAAGADPNRACDVGAETGAFMRDVRTRGETPMHRAAATAGVETIQMLLNAGAKLDAKDTNGDSPLTWGSWHRRPDWILRMLCYGQYSIRAQRKSMEEYLRGEPQD